MRCVLLRKWFLLVLVIALLSVSFPVLASSTDVSTMSDDELKQLKTRIDQEWSNRKLGILSDDLLAEATMGDFYATITGYEFAKDYEGKDCIVVSYRWSHSLETPTSFMVSMMPKVFQNGIQLESAVILDGVDLDDCMLDVQAGYYQDVKSAFLLSDTESSVTISVEELFSLSDNRKAECTLILSK